MARNKYNTRPYKKRGLIPRFHLPTRIMASSHLDPSSLLRPHSPVPSPPLTPAPEPKEDRILFLPRPPYVMTVRLDYYSFFTYSLFLSPPVLYDGHPPFTPCQRLELDLPSNVKAETRCLADCAPLPPLIYYMPYPHLHCTTYAHISAC